METGVSAGGYSTRSSREGFLARALKPDSVSYDHTPNIRERGAQVANAQAGSPQFIMRAGFGEAALANVSKGKTRPVFL